MGKRTRTNRKRCRKVGYHTRAEAERALSDFGRARGATRAYRCDYCTKRRWHLTSS